MTFAELREFLCSQQWAVEATVTPAGAPQAAVIGVAITDSLELIFDTLNSSRKHANLQKDPRIALAIGWDDGRTAQIGAG
jgi:pyridoxine/pyridoxamine 5'-phosphate oxidase